MDYSGCSSSLDVDESLPHSLLEPPSPAYSDTTIRRAFIVWLRCGQRNKFRDVCNFYHHLEESEKKLSPTMRASSRHHEFDMFKNEPPTSSYLNIHFPNLYTHNMDQCIEEVKDNEDKMILQEFERRQEMAARNEIVQASSLIRNYCLAHKKSLSDFLLEFKEHTRKCSLVHNVFNVMFYIRRKLISEELKMIAANPKNFNHNLKLGDILNTNAHINFDKGHDIKQPPKIESTKKIQILRNESRINGVSSDQHNYLLNSFEGAFTMRNATSFTNIQN